MRKFSIILASVIYLGAAAGAATPKGEDIALKSAKKTAMTVSVDGQAHKVTWYVDNYVTLPNRPEDQLINIYIPDNATKSSPIMLYVNNSGWQMNSYPENTLSEDRDYDGTTDRVGVALKEGYVIVSYGGRSRSNGLTGDKYLGHSPAIMVDTKAAIRYLRYNKKALPAGDTEKIIVTGTSGGGALSTVIAASGNSPDYYPFLYEIGAAGIVRNSDGTYSSKEGCGDNVYGVIAYCPITDLGHACAGYEWLYKDTRKVLYLTGEMSYPYADEKTVMAASGELSAMYVKYLDSLGLKDENGNPVNSTTMRGYITALMKDEIAASIEEFGVEQMKKDLEQEIRRRGPGGQGGPGGQMGQRGPRGQNGQMSPGGPGGQNKPEGNNSGNTEHRVSNGWVVFNEDGSFEYDLDKHLYYLAKYTALKVAPSFSNYGLYGGRQNEDSLFGSETDEYAPFNAFSWNNDSVKNNVGKDDTGLDWESYLKTPEGEKLALQIKMACAMDYLLEGKSDTAPYWYVRHGMDDRDASFAIEASLFCSVKSSSKVKDANVGFAWLKPHSGNYDVPEAYSWLKKVLDK